MNSSDSSSGGIGFVGLLTILFIALKLTSVINWSWWMVLFPIWISFGIVLAFIIILLLIVLMAKIFS